MVVFRRQSCQAFNGQKATSRCPELNCRFRDSCLPPGTYPAAPWCLVHGAKLGLGAAAGWRFQLDVLRRSGHVTRLSVPPRLAGMLRADSCQSKSSPAQLCDSARPQLEMAGERTCRCCCQSRRFLLPRRFNLGLARQTTSCFRSRCGAGLDLALDKSLALAALSHSVFVLIRFVVAVRP